MNRVLCLMTLALSGAAITLTGCATASANQGPKHTATEVIETPVNLTPVLRTAATVAEQALTETDVAIRFVRTHLTQQSLERDFTLQQLIAQRARIQSFQSEVTSALAGSGMLLESGEILEAYLVMISQLGQKQAQLTRAWALELFPDQSFESIRLNLPTMDDATLTAGYSPVQASPNQARMSQAVRQTAALRDISLLGGQVNTSVYGSPGLWKTEFELDAVRADLVTLDANLLARGAPVDSRARTASITMGHWSAAMLAERMPEAVPLASDLYRTLSKRDFNLVRGMGSEDVMIASYAVFDSHLSSAYPDSGRTHRQTAALWLAFRELPPVVMRGPVDVLGPVGVTQDQRVAILQRINPAALEAEGSDQ